MIEIIKTAFELTKKNALVLIGLLLSIFVISMLLSFIVGAFPAGSMLYFVFNIISTLLQVYIGIAIVKYILAIVDGREVEFSEIVPSFNEFTRYITSGLLIAVICLVIFMLTIGLLLMIGAIKPNVMQVFTDLAQDSKNLANYSSTEILVVMGVFFLMLIPALIVYLRLQFANYIVIDKPEESPSNAIFMSYRMTKGYTLYLVLLILVSILLNIIGVLLFIVGLVFTIPMTYIIIVVLYRSLEQNYTESNTLQELEN